MFNYVWPMILVIISNVIYQICAKSVPKEMNPFASLFIDRSTEGRKICLVII